MRIPQSPPDSNAIYKKLMDDKARDKIEEIFIWPKAEYNGQYLHWDELRYKKLTDTLLNHQETWLKMKTARRSLYRHIPLMDKHGVHLQYSLVDQILQKLHKIDKLAAGSLKGSDSSLDDPDIRDRYYIKSLIEEAITSSQIEGAATTRKVAKEMLITGRPPRDRSEQMILNNYHALQYIRELKGVPLTIETILKLQEILTTDAVDDPDIIGRYRKPGEQYKVYDKQKNIVLHDPPDANELDERMQRLCDFANDDSEEIFFHPVIRAIVLHFQLAYDHPFCDGNGRTARALFYWAMVKYGYWVCEYISISKIIKKAPAKYGRAYLETETDDNDLTYFLIFNLRVIVDAIDALHQEINRTTKQLREAESLLHKNAALRALNPRQTVLIEHALRHPHNMYTVASHQRANNLSYQTARTDLLALAELNILDKSKRGRAFVFISPAKLKERLSNL